MTSNKNTFFFRMVVVIQMVKWIILVLTLLGSFRLWIFIKFYGFSIVLLIFIFTKLKYWYQRGIWPIVANQNVMKHKMETWNFNFLFEQSPQDCTHKDASTYLWYFLNEMPIAFWMLIFIVIFKIDHRKTRSFCSRCIKFEKK